MVEENISKEVRLEKMDETNKYLRWKNRAKWIDK